MDKIKQKKKDILKKFDKYEVKWEELKEEIKKDEPWGKIWEGKEALFECAIEYELSKKDLKGLMEKSQNKDEFIKESKSVFDSNQNNLKNFLTMEFLWRNRNLTEKIAREIIEDFDCVKVKEGKIYIVVALPLGPFFKDEEEFQKLRLTEDWKNYIDYVEREGNLIWLLHQNGIFVRDKEERELEKQCYDIKAFRGITYNEILTPIYRLESSNFNEIFARGIRSISASELGNQKKEFFTDVLRRVQELLTGWDIKVRITKGGLVNIFFEKDFPNRDYDIKDFADKKRDLMVNPYLGGRLENLKLLKGEQIFTSYLNAAAIWITYIFLKFCNLDQNLVQGIAPITLERITRIVRNLKDPWDVGHKAPHTEEPPRHDIPPPLRNYCVTFLLKDVEGIAWGFDKPLPTGVHFDCPSDIFRCEKRRDGCFIRYLGHSLLALSTNTYVYKDGELKRPWFTQKELENFAKRDLSRWRGELCFIDSETILICTSSRIVKINKEGQPVEYDTYWKSIIKGFSLLVSCKTLAMDISRHLFDCIRQHRHKTERTEKILKRLDIISHLLSRTRFIATPSNISRARYVREKLEAYIEAIGLHEIVSNIEKDYDELDKAIHASIESKRNNLILLLTFLLVPATILTAIGTVIMVCGIDIDRIVDIINITCNETLKDYAIFALCVSFAFYIPAIVIGFIVLWKKAHSIFKN